MFFCEHSYMDIQMNNKQSSLGALSIHTNKELPFFFFFHARIRRFESLSFQPSSSLFFPFHVLPWQIEASWKE